MKIDGSKIILSSNDIEQVVLVCKDPTAIKEGGTPGIFKRIANAFRSNGIETQQITVTTREPLYPYQDVAVETLRPQKVDVNPVEEKKVVEAKVVQVAPKDYPHPPELKPHTNSALTAAYDRGAAQKYINRQISMGTPASLDRVKMRVNAWDLLLDNKSHKEVGKMLDVVPSSVSGYRNIAFPTLPNRYSVERSVNTTGDTVKAMSEMNGASVRPRSTSKYAKYLDQSHIDGVYENAVKTGNKSTIALHTRLREYAGLMMKNDDIIATAKAMHIEPSTCITYARKVFPGSTLDKTLFPYGTAAFITEYVASQTTGVTVPPPKNTVTVSATNQDWRFLNVTHEQINRLNKSAVIDQYHRHLDLSVHGAAKTNTDLSYFRMVHFVQMEFGGYSTQEIAAELSVTPLTVSNMRTKYLL